MVSSKKQDAASDAQQLAKMLDEMRQAKISSLSTAGQGLIQQKASELPRTINL